MSDLGKFANNMYSLKICVIIISNNAATNRCSFMFIQNLFVNSEILQAEAYFINVHMYK